MSYLPISQAEVKEILKKAGVVKEEDWAEAEYNANRRRRGIEEILIERGLITEQYLFELIGDNIKIPYVNLRKHKLDPRVLEEIPQEVAHEARAIPFEVVGDNLKVAFVKAKSQAAIQAIQAVTKKKVVPYLTTIKNFRYAARLYDKGIKDRLIEILNAKGAKTPGTPSVLDLPIIKIVDTILEYAMF